MKRVFVILLLVIFAAGVYFYFHQPKSEYSDINWSSYEHIDTCNAHYYKTLSAKEKVAYEAVLKNYKNFPDKIQVPTLDDKELNRVFTAVIYDNPEAFCLNRNCKMSTTDKTSYFIPQYTMNKTEYEKELKALKSKAKELIQMDYEDDYSAELLFHDYLVDHCEYFSGEDKRYCNAYSALILGKANCEGYTHAMNYLLKQAGVESFAIRGIGKLPGGNPQSHIWNIVKINENYYHLDVTWDDPVFVNVEKDESVRYNYFNVTDAVIKQTHSNYSPDNLCNCEDENYYNHERLIFSSLEQDDKDKITEIIIDTIENQNNSFNLKFVNDDLYKNAKKILIEEQEIYKLLAEANKQCNSPIDDKKIYYRFYDDIQIIELMIVYR